MRYLLILLALVTQLAFGQGFFTQAGKLYKAPVEQRLRGVNKIHWDVVSYGLGQSGANVVRFGVDFNQTPAKSWAAVQTNIMAYGMTPIVGNWRGTCKTDPAILASIVDQWVAQASTWMQLNTMGIVNIANEWGPTSTTQLAVAPWTVSPNPVWRDSYIVAINRMRAAGYTGALMIDAGGCGQDASTVTRFGADLMAADPLHNLIFDIHVYGLFYYPATASWQQDYAKAFAALKASGLPIFIGEFGPINVGPSQTHVPFDQLVSDIEANGWGWAVWAYDDNNLAGCKSDGLGFDMTWTCGGDAAHQDDANLTPWGAQVVAKLRSLNSR